MIIAYNRDNNPFDEIKYESYCNQLIVKRKSIDDNDKIYLCNFFIHSNRGTIKTYITYGMNYLFNIDIGWYNVTLSGSNDYNFELKFEQLSEDNFINTNNQNNKKIEVNQINLSIP